MAKKRVKSLEKNIKANKKRSPVLTTIPENTNPQTLTIKPRVYAICKAYNISDRTLIDFLLLKGYENIGLNSLLDDRAIRLIDSNFQQDKIAKDKVRGLTKIEIERVNPSLEINTKIEISEPIGEPFLYLKEDIFIEIKKEFHIKGYTPLKSYFTDEEVLNICSKMSSSFTRNLCKNVNKVKEDRQLNLYELHHIANKALRLFGGKMLTFILRLRNLNFKNKTADEIRTYRNVIPDFPILSFVTETSTLNISFFLKQNRKREKLDTDIRVYVPKNYKEIGIVNKEGYILLKLEKFRPQLSLFFEATKSDKFKIYSGVETGNCEICDRSLSHPTSLRIGIGPICAKNMGIDTSIYNFSS